MVSRQLTDSDRLSMDHKTGVVARHLHNNLPSYMEIAQTFAFTIYETCMEADRNVHSGKSVVIEYKMLRDRSQHMVDYLSEFVHLKGLALMVHNPEAVNTLFSVWQALLVWNNRIVTLIKLEKGMGSILPYVDHFAKIEDWPTRFGFIAKAQTAMAHEARLKA